MVVCLGEKEQNAHPRVPVRGLETTRSQSHRRRKFPICGKTVRAGTGRKEQERNLRAISQ
jgi:hypothetical protein